MFAVIPPSKHAQAPIPICENLPNTIKSTTSIQLKKHRARHKRKSNPTLFDKHQSKSFDDGFLALRIH